MSTEVRASFANATLRLLILGLLGFLAFGELRPGGDGWYYYVYLPSIWSDHDLDFANEYARQNPMGALVCPETGRYTNLYSIGTAVLWSPFFLVSLGITKAANVFLGAGIPNDGFSPVTHMPITLFGTVVLGAVTLALAREILRRWYPESHIIPAVIGIALGTPYFVYWVLYPGMSHVPSAFAITLGFYLLWRPGPGGAGPARASAAGLALGLALATRPQNLPVLLCSVPDLITWFSGPGPVRSRVSRPLSFLAGVFAGCLPLILSWKYLYGRFITVPHGWYFVDFSRPAFLDYLFSSRHGLITWSPVVLVALVGLVRFTRVKDRKLGSLLLLAYGLEVYINSCAQDWWAGHSFGARRIVDLSFILMIGLGSVLEGIEGWIRDRPDRALRALTAGILLPLILLSTGMAAAWHFRRIPPSGTIRSLDLYARGMESWYELAGNPATWPASLPHALETGTAPWTYDLLGGRYFAFGEYSAGNEIDLARPGDRIYFGTGWETHPCVLFMSGPRAEVLLPVYGGKDHTLTFHWVARPAGATASRLRVSSGGQEIGLLEIRGTHGSGTVTWPGPWIRKGVNIVELEAVQGPGPGVARIHITRGAPSTSQAVP